MRSAALASTVVVLGASAGVALADSLPVPTPTVPTPTVPLPPPPVLPIPTLPTPKLPISSPPVQVSTPSAPTVSSPTVPLAGLGSTGSSSSAAGGSSSSAGAGSSRTSSGSSARSSTSRKHSSRSWIAVNGPKSRRTTVLRFRLGRRARVSFTVLEVAPVCGVAGRFTVQGHRGLNYVRFNGRLHGRQLSPGTYKINARTESGSSVLHMTLVIVSAGVPSPARLRIARRANVCGGTLAANATRTSAGLTAVSRSLPRRSSIVRHQNPSGTGPHGHRSAAPFSPARVSQNAANPFVIAAFGLAVLLLGLAALPQRAVPDPRLNDMLARHRIEVALAGAAALAAALLALALA